MSPKGACWLTAAGAGAGGDKGDCGQQSGELAKSTVLSWIYGVKEDFIGEQEDGKR